MILILKRMIDKDLYVYSQGKAYKKSGILHKEPVAKC